MGVLNGEWTDLHQIWPGHSQIIDAHQVKNSWHNYITPFPNNSGSKLKIVERQCEKSHFLTSVKLGEEWGVCGKNHVFTMTEPALYIWWAAVARSAETKGREKITSVGKPQGIPTYAGTLAALSIIVSGLVPSWSSDILWFLSTRCLQWTGNHSMLLRPCKSLIAW